MSSYLQIAGSMSPDGSPSIFLFFPQKRYVFNVGDGFQRFCTEHKVRLAKVDQFFFTHLSATTLGGLTGLLLTVSDIGVPHININGPSGIRELISSLLKFVHRPDFTVNVNEFLPNSSSEVYSDSHVSVHYFSSQYLSTYIIKTPDSPGKFSTQKAKSHKLTPGPLFSQLAQGKSVKNKFGDEVRPEDVLEGGGRGDVVVIVNFLKKVSLSGCEGNLGIYSAEFQRLSNDILSVVEVGDVVSIVYIFDPTIDPQKIILTSFFKSFTSNFFNSTHLFMIKEASSKLFVSSDSLQNLFSGYFEKFYLNLNYLPSCPFANEIFHDIRNYLNAKVEPAVPLLKFFISSKKECKIETNSKIPKILERIENQINHDELLDIATNIQDKVTKISNNLNFSRAGGVLFLGTGSAIPSKYRNVSSILVSFGINLNLLESITSEDIVNYLKEEKFLILLDCGEGTVGQLFRIFEISLKKSFY
ncbi:hypothetical protein GEMRC1_008366 [Eukaryota sp. GEM-RC1]